LNDFKIIDGMTQKNNFHSVTSLIMITV